MTAEKPCSTCLYSGKLSGSITFCNYLELTGHRRPVPAVECKSKDVYRPRREWQYGLNDPQRMRREKEKLQQELLRGVPADEYDPKKDPVILKLLEGNEED